MRFLGHPVHLMLIHFPVALWPAHFALHVCAPWLPPSVSAVGGFWLLAAGTLLGWLAAGCGVFDLVLLSREPGSPQFRAALIHASVNGLALTGFTALAAFEASKFPQIHLNPGLIILEGALLVAMFVGNYFGGEVVWGGRSVISDQQSLRPERR